MKRNTELNIGLTGIVIVILIVIVLIVVYYVVTYRKLTSNTESLVLRPFAAYEGEAMIRSDNSQPQIQCPVGTKVNIINAVYEVNDPQLQCVQLDSTGKATSKPMPGADPNCFCSYQPVEKGMAFLSGPSKKATSTAKPATGTSCSYSSSGNGPCRIRNVTASVASVANGKQSIVFNVNSSVLGPQPCSNMPADAGGGTDYTVLPQGSTNKPYILHGVYTCVPE